MLNARRGARAIILDLDDTLYPERRFALSGLAAVAHHAHRAHGIPAAGAFGVLRRALAGGRRDRAFQDLVAHYRLPDHVIPRFLEVYRQHDPRLRLPRRSHLALTELRRSWRIGLLTNGDPEIQARKVAALGLARYVDAVVFAETTGAAKPAGCAFRTALERLDGDARRAVFVGDHPVCDIAGARAIGMKTIHVRRPIAHDDADGCGADWTVDSMAMVPGAADALVPGRDHCHA